MSTYYLVIQCTEFPLKQKKKKKKKKLLLFLALAFRGVLVPVTFNHLNEKMSLLTKLFYE